MGLGAIANISPVTPDDVRRQARALDVQVLDGDMDAIAAIVNSVRRAVDEARPLAQESTTTFAFPAPPRRARRRRPSTLSTPQAADPQMQEATPASDDLTSQGVAGLATLIGRGIVSPVEAAQAYLRRIADLDPRLHAYITVTEERALEDARKAEREIARGRQRSPLHGVPVAYKDMVLTRGIRTTFHSRVFADYIPDVNAAVVDRLVAAGTVMLGKTNTYELGAGDGDLFGQARNPWDLERQPGGSSSGSGVAVAARLAAGAIGTDAGGSIRVPAAFCGIIGLKPTYGWVSRYPSDGCSVASVGPMTLTAVDAALMMDAIAGPDPRDAATAGVPAPAFARALTGDIRGIRIGVADEDTWAPIDVDVQAAIGEAVRVLRDLGAAVEPVHLPHAGLAEVLGMVIAHTECHGRHSHFLKDRAAEIGTFFRRALTASQFYSAADYLIAQRVRALIAQDFAAAHKRADVILTPTVPYPAFRFGETRLGLQGGEVNPRTGMGRLTRLSNLTGLPAISVPCGFTTHGLPLAFQLMGRAFEDAGLLNVAHAYQRVTGWHERCPPVALHERFAPTATHGSLTSGEAHR